jgi:hypothetical protein
LCQNRTTKLAIAIAASVRATSGEQPNVTAPSRGREQFMRQLRHLTVSAPIPIVRMP